jgi:hypothetical protein
MNWKAIRVITRACCGNPFRLLLRRQFQIRLGNQRLQRRGHFADQFGGATEGDLGLAGDEFGRGEQQRRVLAVADTPQVVGVAVMNRIMSISPGA